jgi:hypothetical protein
VRARLVLIVTGLSRPVGIMRVGRRLSTKPQRRERDDAEWARCKPMG